MTGANSRGMQCTTSSISNFLFQNQNVLICFHLSAEIKRVDENATASVSCPALKELENTSITLYKGDTKLHSSNPSEMDSNETLQRFQVYIQNSSVSYKILRTEVNDTGLYKCTIDAQIRTAVSQTLLLIKGKAITSF